MAGVFANPRSHLPPRNPTEPRRLMAERAAPSLETSKNGAEKPPPNQTHTKEPSLECQPRRAMERNFLSGSLFGNLSVDFIRNRSHAPALLPGPSGSWVRVSLHARLLGVLGEKS